MDVKKLFEEPKPDDIVWETTNWERHLYADISESDGELKRIERAGQSRFGVWPKLQEEMFSSFYANDLGKIDQSPAGLDWARTAFEQANDLPEIQRLRSRTAGDTFASQIATSQLAETIMGALPEQKQKDDPEQLREDIQSYQELLDQLQQQGAGNQGKSQERVKRAGQRAEKRLEQSLQQGAAIQQALDPAAIRNAMRLAAEQAGQQIAEVEEALATLGQGAGMGTGGGSGTPNALSKLTLARSIQHDAKLQQLLKIAGRFQRIAATKQRSKIRHGGAEVVGITTGADISKMLPFEAVRASHPSLQMQWLQDWSNQNLLIYQTRLQQPEGKGPIIALVDVSGSMSGPRDMLAKGLCMGLLLIAQQQKRKFAMIQFDGSVTRSDIFDPSKAKIDPTILLAMLNHFTGGGTDFKPPIDMAVDIIDQDVRFKKADVILITDGHGHYNDQPKLARVKYERDTNFFGISINCSVNDRLTEICAPNKPIEVQDLHVNSGDEHAVTEQIFTI